MCFFLSTEVLLKQKLCIFTKYCGILQLDIYLKEQLIFSRIFISFSHCYNNTEKVSSTYIKSLLRRIPTNNYKYKTICVFMYVCMSNSKFIQISFKTQTIRVIII